MATNIELTRRMSRLERTVRDLRQELDRREVRDALAESITQLKRGQVTPADEVFEKLRRKGSRQKSA